MATIGIDWKQPRLHIIGAGGKKDYEHPEIKLMPGMNVIDKDAWAAVRENKMPALEALIDAGDLEEIEPKEGGADLDKTLPKAATPALKMIANTFVLTQLEKWKASEERPPIRAAIEKQIVKVNEAKRDSKTPEE